MRLRKLSPRWLGALLLSWTGLLLLLPFFESDVQYGFVRDTSISGKDFEELTETHNKTVHYFDSHGTKCEAWLYLPRAGSPDVTASADSSATSSHATAADAADSPPPPPPAAAAAGKLKVADVQGSSSSSAKSKGSGLINKLLHPTRRKAQEAAAPPPVILMAHGLGVQKDHKLPQYAAQFAAQGYAVLLFDYRTWGGSDGEPRQVVSGPMFAQDYESALDHVRATGGLGGQVDAARVVLFGTSYSGGHSVVVAARRPHHVAAVVAMEPFLGAAHTEHASRLPRWREVVNGPRILVVALHDVTRAQLGLPRLYLPLLAPRGSARLALGHMRSSEYRQFMGSMPSKMLGGWQNKVLAATVFEHARYHPIWHIHKVCCPLFFVLGLEDEMTPAGLILRGLQQAKASSRTSFTAKAGATHITLYNHPDVIPDMVSFLQVVGLGTVKAPGVDAAAVVEEGVVEAAVTDEPVP